MRIRKKIIRFFFQLVWISVACLVLFEVAYRFSIIDFYAAETAHLNSEEERLTASADFLVFGDSFSATAKEINYVDKLRALNPELTIVNVSVPGIGIRQVNTFAENKIEEFQPKAIIYQIYVGNDLIDVDHLWSWEHFSAARNVYWELSDHFLSLSYLNHKATVFSPRANERTLTMATDKFQPEYYDQRTKRFLSYDASYIENMLNLQGEFKSRYKTWLAHMQTFMESVPKNIQVYLVWIPHCSQVNTYYAENLQKLGAAFDTNESFQTEAYPFSRKQKTI